MNGQERLSQEKWIISMQNSSCVLLGWGYTRWELVVCSTLESVTAIVLGTLAVHVVTIRDEIFAQASVSSLNRGGRNLHWRKDGRLGS